MVEEFCYVADDYNTEVDAMSKPDGLAERDRIVQFPFTVAVSAELYYSFRHISSCRYMSINFCWPTLLQEKDEKTEEELALQAERRKQSGLRLQEQTQKLRLEKVCFVALCTGSAVRLLSSNADGLLREHFIQLMQKENDLQYYAQLKEWKNKERKGEYLVSSPIYEVFQDSKVECLLNTISLAALRGSQKRLESEGFETEQELENIIKKTEAALKRARARELGADPEEEKVRWPSHPYSREVCVVLIPIQRSHRKRLRFR